MPVVRPSLALGILHSILAHNNISVATSYANILWCEKIGILRYEFTVNTWMTFGDWIFAQAAFPDSGQDGAGFFADFFGEQACQYLDIKQADFPTVLREWRKAASEFVDELAFRIANENPRIVAASSSISEHASSLALFRRIRDIAPEIVTVMGGANCESVMGLTTHEQFPWVDFVVSGEADDIVADLMQGILDKGRNLEASDLPEGVFAPVHRQTGYMGLRENPPRAVSASFHNNPVPNYDDYFNALNASPVLSQVVRPGLPVEGSRGCWWGEKKHCRFCSASGISRKYRKKSSEKIVEEIESFNNRYGVNWFGFSDNITNMSWFHNLFPKFSKKAQSYRISCEISPVVGKKQLKIMKAAGVCYSQPGIESLDTQILRLLNKANQSWQNIRFLKWCAYYGIHMSWWLLDDVPGSDHGWYERTGNLCPLLCHLQPPRTLYRIGLCRFSDYHRNAEKYKFELEANDAYSQVYPIPKTALNNLAYLLKDAKRDGRWSKPPADRQKLVDAVAEWNHLFYSVDRPVLEMHDTGKEIHVRDTRPAATRPKHTLGKDERAVILGCEHGIKKDRLYHQFEDKRMPVSRIDSIVAGLVDDKILLSVDGRLLSLGIPKTSPNSIKRQGFSCGSSDKVLYMAIQRLQQR